MTRIDRKKILEMIYDNQISAEEGFRLFKEIGRDQSPDHDQPEPGEDYTDKDFAVNAFPASPHNGSTGESRARARDIAVIGMAGQFADAKNIDEYWQNLVSGKDSVAEISRWDMSSIYNPDRQQPNSSYSKWGGFLGDIGQFDPLFFNLSPKQAEFMEPRQRLFLQEAWRALEDAGYSNKALEGKKCGVFVGCEGSTDYFQNKQYDELNAHFFLGYSNSVLSSRISYFMDLQGPNITIDTACSSSLVAIHLACESIRDGDSDLALAGGVTVTTMPEGYILLSNMGVLSPVGRCKTFDNDADGYVPGEAVAVIVLKPLALALKDHDHIYGVIKGSGINQDGKTNGITAPSAVSQARLEDEVYRRTGINPETISYVEAHGTGTKLGDPIEFEALKTAFQKYTNQKYYCAIGSVKTNIGHTGAASGVSGIIKILLALKNRQLVPSLHFNRWNEKIDYQDQPFYVNNELKPWPASGDHPRRAAISSFGHGGTNCHMIVEEAPVLAGPASPFTPPYYLLPFSAKIETALRQRIVDFRAWFDREGGRFNLADIVFTLQTGRSHFPIRTVLIAKNPADLQRQLAELSPNGDSINCFTPELPPEVSQDSGRQIIKELLELPFWEEDKYLEKLRLLAKIYGNGYDPDWLELYRTAGCAKVSLPTYPFAGEHYWLPEDETALGRNRNLPPGTYPALGPLIDFNDSTFIEQRFTKIFSGEEFFLKDHGRMLPGVVYLEMARACGEAAYPGARVKRIKNIVWSNPITLGDKPEPVHIGLFPRENQVEWEVYTMEAKQRVIHAQGKLVYDASPESSTPEEFINISQIMDRCRGDEKAAATFYQLLESLGAYLGPRFKGIRAFYFNECEALTRLGVVPELEKDYGQYLLFPTLLDGGIQTVVAWAYQTMAKGDAIYLPFVLGELEIVGSRCRNKLRLCANDLGKRGLGCSNRQIQYFINGRSRPGRAPYERFHTAALSIPDGSSFGKSYGERCGTL